MVGNDGGADQTVTPFFLVSLPRSGSTLLQRILGSHPQIATSAEPWLLLPLLYALRDEGVYAEYGHRLAATAIQDFCGRLPHGVDSYRMAIRHAVLDLYDQAAGSKAIWLDKTPRYMLVVDELLTMFPDGRFICLWRNPLSIVSSLSQSWAGGRWQPYHHKIDLFDGLENLVETVARHPDRFVVVRYEDLVRDPHASCQSLMDALGLPWDDSMLSSFSGVDVSGYVGDRTGTRNATVSDASLSKWVTILASPVRKAWCNAYLEWIGRERLAVMGYEKDRLQHELNAAPPDWSKVVPDSVGTLKGVAYNFIEPLMIKNKVRRARRWSALHNHT